MQKVEQLRHLSNAERLEVVEAANTLVRDYACFRPAGPKEQKVIASCELAAASVRDLYEPGGDLTEWTALDCGGLSPMTISKGHLWLVNLDPTVGDETGSLRPGHCGQPRHALGVFVRLLMKLFLRGRLSRCGPPQERSPHESLQRGQPLRSETARWRSERRPGIARRC